MPSSSTDEVERILRRARVQLTLRHPFLATSTLRLPFKSAHARSWCPTMATDGYHIFYSPDWVAGLTPESCMGVIAHEVLHAVLGHPDRRGARDALLWNMAADYAINLLLVEQGFTLPPGGLCDRGYRGLTTEDIYARLVQRGVSAAHGGEADTEHMGASMPGAAGSIDLLDPGDLRTADVRDADAPDAELRRLLRRQLLSEVSRELHGTSAGFLAAEITTAAEGRIDWRQVLRRFLFDRVRNDWRSFPYSKRWIHRGLFLPSVGTEAPGHIVIAIDTSGSMQDNVLADVFGEVRALRETYPCQLTVIQCDATIQSTQEYAAEDGTEVPKVQQALGRGGTDFRPVFNWVHESAGTPHAALLFFTDGYGTFPKAAPAWPVLWLVVQQGAADKAFPFGTVCRVS